MDEVSTPTRTTQDNPQIKCGKLLLAVIAASVLSEFRQLFSGQSLIVSDYSSPTSLKISYVVCKTTNVTKSGFVNIQRNGRE